MTIAEVKPNALHWGVKVHQYHFVENACGFVGVLYSQQQ